jgi:muramoyltetrapeptide carboxypeptidase LdcA involved in peptidoglycan recycling
MIKSIHASPLMVAGLAMASWETIFRRTWLMATGACSFLEYEAMLSEKMAASVEAVMAFMGGQGTHAILAPYLDRAEANAIRLRAKR